MLPTLWVDAEYSFHTVMINAFLRLHFPHFGQCWHSGFNSCRGECRKWLWEFLPASWEGWFQQGLDENKAKHFCCPGCSLQHRWFESNWLIGAVCSSKQNIRYRRKSWRINTNKIDVEVSLNIKGSFRFILIGTTCLNKKQACVYRSPSCSEHLQTGTITCNLMEWNIVSCIFKVDFQLLNNSQSFEMSLHFATCQLFPGQRH